MKTKFEYYEQALKKKLEQSHYKQLRCVVPLDEAPFLSQDEAVINFNSNDFLGLSENDYVKKKTIQYVLRWGAGSSSYRFLPEHLQCQKNTEKKIAQLLHSEDALLFSSDFQAHTHILSTIGNSRSIVFIDKHCKNSLFHGAYQSKAEVLRYDHNDLEHLEELLEKHKQSPAVSKIIVVESLFHYDGDYADLKQLAKLSKKYNTLLYVDDSYTVGVLGQEGMGLCSDHKGIDFVIGTFGKACGSYGAYLACNSTMRQYILNFCPAFTQMMTLPPAVLGAIDAALDLIPDMEEERKHIKDLSLEFRKILQTLEADIVKSDSHVICLEISEEKILKKLLNFLSNHNLFAALIKPPNHLHKGPRLRFTITSLHLEKHLEILHEVLKEFSLRNLAIAK